MRVSILKLARNDLREIREYLSEFGASPPEKFCRQVADMPYMFTVYKHNPKYRKAVAAYGYLIFYQVDEKRGIVKVYRVLHGKRIIAPLLEEET